MRVNLNLNNGDDARRPVLSVPFAFTSSPARNPVFCYEHDFKCHYPCNDSPNTPRRYWIMTEMTLLRDSYTKSCPVCWELFPRIYLSSSGSHGLCGQPRAIHTRHHEYTQQREDFRPLERLFRGCTRYCQVEQTHSQNKAEKLTLGTDNLLDLFFRRVCRKD